MRYIDKSNRCIVFDDFVKTYQGRLRNDWEKFKKIKGGSTIRLILHQFMWRTQKGLCCYCEQEVPYKISADDSAKSHFEHIRPKALKAFKHLTYQFENIVISCEGFDLALDSENKKEFCGHIKDDKNKGNEYDDAFFLNPTEILDVEGYFRYDSEGNIEPNPIKTDNEQNRATYMIRILGLDHPDLIGMRQKQYSFWEERKREIPYEQFVADLDENLPFLPSFFSFLKQRFL